SSILHTRTSISENFNTFGYVLTNSSPATDTNYTPNAAYPNWIYDVWYEATVKLDAFGTNGYGYHDVVAAHASPDKDDEPASPEADSLIPPACPRTEIRDVIICEGESYFLQGALQTAAGIYYDTLVVADTCTIYVTSRLILLPASRTSRVVDI